MTDRSEEGNAGRQEMNDCMSECRNVILLLESHPMAGLIVCQWVAFGWHSRIAAKQTLCEDEASLAGLEAMEIAIDAMESALG